MTARSIALGAALACAAAASAAVSHPLDYGWEFKWGADKEAGEWKTVDLPHDAQFEQPWEEGKRGSRGFKPMGEMWYRKSFSYGELGPAAHGKRVFLELGGLLCTGDVYLNGRKVGGTDYGYLPVWADLTEAIKKEKDAVNLIEVWCSTGPFGGSRWYTGAGLYRDAKIVMKPWVSIARHGVFVKSAPEGADARVDVSVELDGFTAKGRDENLTVKVDLKDAAGKVVASSSARAKWTRNPHQEVAVPTMTVKGARLWDLDSPNLYTADVRILRDGKEADSESVRFGVRKIEFDRAFGMKLNGRKVFLKSISNHHDLGAVGAAAYRRAIRRQFETMKKFGYNAVRCSHNPYSEDFYELADEMGLLVMDELIDKWSDKHNWFGRRPFTQVWPEMVTAWMKRDRNHPCVFAWSFGNELQHWNELCGYQDVNDWGVTMYKVMKTFSERWDTTRPTTVAMFPAEAEGLGMKDEGFRDDPHPPELSLATDFASYNYMYWAYPSYVKYAPNLNIFQSEATVKSLQAPYLSMDYDHSIGCSYWGAIEYWGESDGWPKKGWNYSFFSHALEPYPSAYLVKSVMTPDEPVLWIAVESGKEQTVLWNDIQVGCRNEVSAWEGNRGDQKYVRVYTNLEEVELFLDGKSLGRRSNPRGAKPQDRNIVSYKVPFEPGVLKAVGKSADGRTLESVLRTAGKAVRFVAEAESDDYVADGHDLVYVKCRALDANGTQVGAAANKVSFKCEGAAKFLACDNGDHSTGELFTPEITAKKMNGGFILGVFRCGTRPGVARITVTPEGLPPATVEVKVAAAKK